MTIDETLVAMSAVESLYDGSLISAERIASLAIEHIEHPEHFWETFFQMVGEDDPMREKAIRLIKSGKISEASTMDELAKLMAEQQ